MYREYFLIIDNEAVDDEYKQIINFISDKYSIDVKVKLISTEFEKKEDIFYLLFLSDIRIKEFLQENLYKNINIAILPNKMCKNAILGFGILNNLHDAIDDAFNLKLLSKVDILKCNNELVFTRVEIGDMHGISCCNSQNFLLKIKNFFYNLQNLKFIPFSFTTSKEHTFKTVASGVTILEHSIKNSNTALKDDLSRHDGKLNAFVLSQASLISYLWYLVLIFFYEKISLISLPKSLGFIRSTKLTINLDDEINYIIDNESFFKAKEINLEVLQDCLYVHLGRNFIQNVRNEPNSLEEKDSIKVNMLPKGELNEVLIQGKIPFFKKASDEDIKELFISLKDSSKFHLYI